MTYAVLDVETTTNNKGNPFDETNKLAYIGINKECFPIDYGGLPFGDNIAACQSILYQARMLVGFNIKFDLHWVRKYGLDFSTKQIWDCQLVHFIISGQSDTMPSLNDVAAYYGLKPKLDVVKTEYWDRGIDTMDIPADILEEYLLGDLELTEQVYLKQREYIATNPLMAKLQYLHNRDLLVLQEMEYNGILFNKSESLKLAEETKEQIKHLDADIYSFHNLDCFNLNSPDQLSILLYGGLLSYKRREVIGTFKTGDRKGQPKEGWVDYTKEFPRLVRPLKGSELSKPGYWSTDEPTLRSLKANAKAQKLIDLLLERAELDKRVSTYYEGIPKLQKELNWKEGMIHGQLNQCVARTGRLSSSRPNMQNFDGEIKHLFPSRFNG